MATTYTAQHLADGQLPNTETTLYTYSGSGIMHVTTIGCFNTNTTNEAVVLKVNWSGTAQRVGGSDALGANELYLYPGKELLLVNGDLIRGSTTTASKVNYWIDGYEETH